jgi:TP901 family phage tail tape measure protein
MSGASKVRAGQAFVEIGADPRKLFAALGKINARIGKLGQSMVSMGSRMTAIGAAVAAPIALATRQFSVFDDAIRATAAVSGATGAALQSMNDRARELGATTSFTAVQVANLMTELGRAGFKPDEINAMTGAVLNLARATGTDAALSAGIMAATLRQFGLQAGDAARAADVLTKAANATFNTVEGLGESLKFAGPVAKSLGMSLEDTVAVLGVLGNVGIQGSEAGTALRRLSVIAAGSGDELQKLFGVTNTDAAGNLKPLVDILDEINTVTANMPVADRTAKMAQAFGLLGITSANVLSSSAEGVRGLADQLRNAEGTAAKTAKEMDAGLGGAIRILLSAVEGTALAIGDALAPSMQKLAEIVTNVAGGLTEFVKKNQEMVVAIAKGVAIFVATGAALIGLGVALKVVSAAAALAGGAFMFALSPIGLIVVAVGGMAAAALYFSGALGDMGKIAGQTFGGIYDAIAGGDISGAMDILWAGLEVAWLRGVAAVGGYADAFITGLQNSFTYLATSVMNIWEGMNSGMGQGLVTIKGVIMGIVDNIVNGVLQAFDAMVVAVAKSWNWVQSFIVKGYDLAEENRKVDDAADARAQRDSVLRPGLEGRMAQASAERKGIRDQADRNIAANNQAADAAYAGRAARNAENAAIEGGRVTAAQGRLNTLTRDASDRRIFRGQADEVIDSVTKAKTMAELRDLSDQFHALAATGKLSEAQTKRYAEAVDMATDTIEDRGGSAGGAAAPVNPDDLKRAAMDAAASQAEVAGTFSAAAVGGMGLGQSLQQKQVDLLGKIEANTRENEGGFVND